MKLQGKVWRFGDDLGATDIVSAKYDKAGMAHDWVECGKHLMEDIAPHFAAEVRPGDIVIAGRNLGRGHAHYYTAAVMACKVAGISAILCESVNALFQRAAIDQGFLVWALHGVSGMAEAGERVDADLGRGSLHNLTRDTVHPIPVLPGLVVEIVTAGSSMDWALRRVGAAETAA